MRRSVFTASRRPLEGAWEATRQFTSTANDAGNISRNRSVTQPSSSIYGRRTILTRDRDVKDTWQPGYLLQSVMSPVLLSTELVCIFSLTKSMDHTPRPRKKEVYDLGDACTLQDVKGIVDLQMQTLIYNSLQVYKQRMKSAPQVKILRKPLKSA